MKLPRNAQIWLPGYLKCLARPRPAPKSVYVMIGDHHEPLRGGATDDRGRARVRRWQEEWPRIAARHRDSDGNPPVYTFFYPEEEYRPFLLDPLAGMSRDAIADVEIHIHHDGEGEQNFRDRMRRFIEVLHRRHGLLHEENGQVKFGFIHGNWALDNSLPNGRWCGLNNELSILADLGCYADFTLPSAPSPAQTRIVNSIYWAKDDPTRPKSHDHAAPRREGDLLMIQGPLALNWRKRGLEVGELAGHNPVTRNRVRLWLRYAPRIGNTAFIKLFAHGAWEKNTDALLQRDLDIMFHLLKEECADLHYVSAWQMYQACRVGFQPAGRLSAGPHQEAA
jgi:hypothetical protein